MGRAGPLACGLETDPGQVLVGHSGAWVASVETSVDCEVTFMRELMRLNLIVLQLSTAVLLGTLLRKLMGTKVAGLCQLHLRDHPIQADNAEHIPWLGMRVAEEGNEERTRAAAAKLSGDW